MKKVDFGPPSGERFLETRHLSCRDFFGQEDDGYNNYSVLSTSFAEVYTIHVNDLKAFTSQSLKKMLASFRTFAQSFARYNDADYLIAQFKAQRGWEDQKKVVMREVRSPTRLLTRIVCF